MATAVMTDTIMYQLAERLKDLKTQKKNLEADLKDINGELAVVEADLAEVMASDEVQNFTRDGNMFYLSNKLYASTKAGQQEALSDWLKENGHGAIVKETVHHQTLNAFVKELLSDDELPEELEDMVNVFEKVTVGVRKAPKK